MTGEVKKALESISLTDIQFGTPSGWLPVYEKVAADKDENQKQVSDLEERVKTLEKEMEELKVKILLPLERVDKPQMRAKVFPDKKEAFPPEVLKRIVSGENPLRVYRELRQLTGQQLAEKVGVSQAYISQLETDRRTGTTEVMKKIAKVLDVSLDLLV